MYKCFKLKNHETIRRIREVNPDGSIGKVCALIGQVREMVKLNILSVAPKMGYDKWVVIPKNTSEFFDLDYDTLDEAKAVYGL